MDIQSNIVIVVIVVIFIIYIYKRTYINVGHCAWGDDGVISCIIYNFHAEIMDIFKYIFYVF